MVTTNAGHSKPGTSLDEVVLTPLMSTGSASNMLSLSSSKDRTDKYTFTTANETSTVPSPFYSLLEQYDKKDTFPNVNMEISFSSVPIAPFPATKIVSPQTRENHGDLKLANPNPWLNSITTTMSPSTGTSHSQTNRDITVHDASTRSFATGKENKSKMDINRHDKTELPIKSWGMSTDHILSLWDTSGQKINRGTNHQTANSSKGTEIGLEHVNMLTVIQSESNLRKEPQASNAKAIIQQQDSQIVLSGSDSGTRSNDTSDTPSNGPGDRLIAPIPQSNLVEIALEEMEMTHTYLEGRNACPSPLIPDHGIFNFRGLVGPSPSQYKYYVQYSCNSGYTLTHGDQFSFCQHNGVWSGQVPTCADVNECIIGLNDCQQICVNTFGSYKCNCQTGFLLSHDGKTCADIDECILPVGIASCLFGCINTAGSFMCHCPEGYQLSTNNGHCKDIDECAENNGRGSCAMECQNTPGSFSCSCSYGYKLAGDGHSCIAECPSGYRKENHIERPNWHREIQQCLDINECLDGFSEHRPCEWKCLNLPGSYRCICPRGYRLNDDKHHCEDVNECSYTNGGCSHLCINTNGGYRCECPEGHSFSPYSRKTCQAIGI
ncbi:uncharacterized protein LOC103177488 [Callorhinchus milii]|uniref:uncharacterized protein LOC103177488 n=1 Tax=Callorhinchus milii TaxID=7868 RepID=UPI001C3F7032|nr:uncharacterized protein LOC103177488 [Callorhinchus milii]